MKYSAILLFCFLFFSPANAQGFDNPEDENQATGYAIPPVKLAFSLRPGVYFTKNKDWLVKVDGEVLIDYLSFQWFLPIGIEYKHKYFSAWLGIGYANVDGDSGFLAAYRTKVNIVPRWLAVIAKGNLSTWGPFYYGRYKIDLNIDINSSASVNAGLMFEHQYNFYRYGFYVGIQALCFHSELQLLLGPTPIEGYPLWERSNKTTSIYVRWVINLMNINVLDKSVKTKKGIKRFDFPIQN